MPTRHFNFTNCKRLRRDCAAIQLDTSEAIPTASGALYLDNMELPSDSELVLEAYVEWVVMRFPCGTVGAPKVPATMTLTEFDSTEGVKFRLKVLGVGDHAGLILAEADGIQPSAYGEPEAARSFVRVHPADLGAVVWSLSFDTVGPLLNVNERLADWKSFLNAAGVRALVFPEVLRQVLREAIQRGEDDESDGDWPSQAERVAISLGFGPLPGADDDDEGEEWVENVVRKFAQRHRLWNGVFDLIGGD